jgi:chromosomal replication initiation ATPase DnaA
VYAALGLLDSGHLVTCTADGLGGYAALATQAERAARGVLLINDAHLLDYAPEAIAELLRLMRDHRDKFMIVCAGPPDEMNAFLVANPGFRAEFGAIIEFRSPSEYDLVRLFSRFAERDLYVLDEDLRVRLLRRFAEMREIAGFANATTARRLLERVVARQAARVARDRLGTAEAARLTARDLPDA